MATKAQIAANRKNAKKSTGPRTAEGKAAASKNAVKHGFFARDDVVRDEKQEDFDLYREEMLAEMGPVGVMETTLAERIVNLAWRLRRAEKMQDQALKMQMRSDMLNLVVRQVQWTYRDVKGLPQEESYPKDDHMALGRAARNDIANYRVLEKLLMYERRIESSMMRMIKEFERIKSRRQAEQTRAVVRQSAAQSPPAQRHKGNLTKRSQLGPVLTVTKACAGKDYDYESRSALRRNKPNIVQAQPEKGGCSRIDDEPKPASTA